MKYIPVLSFLFVLGSCVSPQKALLQTWKITDVVFLDSLNTLPEQQKKILTHNLTKNVQFSFLPDSAYQVRSAGETVNGKWWLSADKKTLFTVTPMATVESKLLEVKKKSLKFESNGEQHQSFLFTCAPVTDKK